MQRMKCKFCPKVFSRSDNRLAHERICGNQGSGVTLRKRTIISRAASESFWISKVSTAFANANCKWKLRYFPNDGSNFIELLKESTAAMEGRLEKERRQKRSLKFNMSLHVIFEQAIDPSIKTVEPVVFNTRQAEYYVSTDISTVLKSCADQLERKVEDYQGLGRGWIISSLLALDTTAWILDPLRASSYHPLPN